MSLIKLFEFHVNLAGLIKFEQIKKCVTISAMLALFSFLYWYF
jgi:hypothetical protein